MLVYATYLGGSGDEWGSGGIAVDGAGHAYVTGGTDSTDFPTTPDALQLSLRRNHDVFVARFNANGTALTYSTYLGGSGDDHGNDIAVDGAGHVYVTGWTGSTDFPTTPDALQPNKAAFGDAFVARINVDGMALVYATYLGGGGNDWGLNLAVDSAGHAYVVGHTYSPDFPTTPDALQPSFGGGNDEVFVAKLAMNANNTTTGLYSPTSGTFYLRNSHSAGVADLVFRFGPANVGWVPLVGDWDGNGTDTVGLFNPATSTFYLRNSHSAGVADLAFRFGPANAGWIPLVGDWDGNGTATVGLFNPATSTFYLHNSHSAGAANLAFRFGPANAGWIPLVGDWNGDHLDTVGLFDPTTSTFYLKNSNSPGVGDVTFRYGPAGKGWEPLMGDWDGNGIDTAGLFDPATSTFYLRNSHSAGVADLAFRFGPANAGWIPLAGDWNGPGL